MIPFLTVWTRPKLDKHDNEKSYIFIPTKKQQRMWILIPSLGMKLRNKIFYSFRENLEKRKSGPKSFPSHPTIFLIAQQLAILKIIFANTHCRPFILQFYNLHSTICNFTHNFTAIILLAVVDLKTDLPGGGAFWPHFGGKIGHVRGPSIAKRLYRSFLPANQSTSRSNHVLSSPLAIIL